MPHVLPNLKGQTLVYFLILYSTVNVLAQTSRVDALLGQLNKNNPDTTQIKIMRKLSAAYSAVDPSKKLYYTNQYKELAEKNGIDSVVASAYLDIGIYYGIRSQLDSALFYFHRGFEKSKAVGYEIGIARSHANIGYAYDKLDRKQDAVKNYEASLKIYRKLNIKKSINQNITNLGSLYFDLGEYKIAHAYFLQVYENVKESPTDQMGLADALFSLAGSYRKMRDLKKSEDFYQRSLKIREAIGDLNGIALSNWGIALVYNRKKEYDRALSHLEVALRNNLTLKKVDQEAMVHLSIARAHLGLKNYQAAEKAANLALLRAKESKLKGPLADALRVLSEVNAAQKNFEEALRLQAHYIKVDQQISSGKREVIKNDIVRINADNKKLENSNKIIIEENSDYVILISFIGASLVILAALLALYYKRNSDKKGINLILQKQKQEVANANEELIVQMDIVSAQNMELEKLNSVKNKFFSIISHDVRGPLITLKSLFELYRNGDLDQETLDELLKKIENTTSTTVTFLDQLLEWSKNQLEGVRVKPVDLKIHQIVADNMALMESQIESKDLRVMNLIEANTLVFADYNMINIVFRNLLSNAIKFCHSGDEIVFEATVNGPHVTCKISDSGKGMDDAEKEDLFNLSHTLSKGTAGEKGYHIGLILCRDMIVQNKGTIGVTSALGKGTTFSITLPAQGQMAE